MFREMREETHWKETIWEGTAINEVFDPSKQELEHFELFPSHVTDDRKAKIFVLSLFRIAWPPYVE